MEKLKKKNIANGILIISVLLLGGGFYCFERYKFTEGLQVQAPRRFPAAVHSYLDSTVPTLILFAHPKCTCTEASLVQLGKLKEELGRKIAVKVFVSYDLEDSSAELEKIESQARQIPEVEVQKDIDRVIAKQFDALTSGQAMLYAPEGNLLFQGGLTISRGHVGDSPGARKIKQLITSPFIINSYGRMPTFGCHL